MSRPLVDPAELLLNGAIGNDYRARVDGITTVDGGRNWILLSFIDDVPKPEGAERKPTLHAVLVAPKDLDDEGYRRCRREFARRIQTGERPLDMTV